MEKRKIQEYLSEPVNRTILSQIINNRRSVSLTELSKNLSVKINTPSLYSILKNLTELGLVKKKEISIGSQKKEFYCLNQELYQSDFYQELLLKYEDLNWPSKLSMNFTYNWNDWPDCLIMDKNLSLFIVYGSNLSESFNISELSKLITYWGLQKKINYRNILLKSVIDRSAGPYKNENLLLIGSTETNKITSDVFELYSDSLPIRFQTNSIVSYITNSKYSDIRNAILGVIPNPWNVHKIVVLCAGYSQGTQAAFNILIDDFKAILNNEPRILRNHALYSEIPLRVILSRTKGKGNEKKLDQIKNYSFIE